MAFHGNNGGQPMQYDGYPAPDGAPKKQKISINELYSIDVHTFNITVGPDHARHVFIVPKALLCLRSSYFDLMAYLDIHDIALHTIDVNTFSILLTWVATLDIEHAEQFIEITGHTYQARWESCKQQWTQLVHCYILGDTISSKVFKNAVIDLLIANAKLSKELFDIIAGASFFEIEMVFTNTRPECPLQRLIADNTIASRVTYPAAPKVRIGTQETGGRGYAVALANAGIRASGPGVFAVFPWLKDPAEYHE